jgi:hypothetical protein
LSAAPFPRHGHFRAAGDAGGVLVLTAWFGFRRLTSFVSGESALKVFMVSNHATTQPNKSGFPKAFRLAQRR